MKAIWAEFKCGQVVRLKSGGPKMTVRDHYAPHVQCDWFAGDTHQSQTFEYNQITDADNPGSEMVEHEYPDTPS